MTILVILKLIGHIVETRNLTHSTACLSASCPRTSNWPAVSVASALNVLGNAKCCWYFASVADCITDHVLKEAWSEQGNASIGYMSLGMQDAVILLVYVTASYNASQEVASEVTRK